MSSWINGNLQGSLSVGQGERGKSLQHEWRGTELGIRVEGEEEYQFVDLAPKLGGGNGREIELQVGNGYIQWRYKGEESWNNLISIDSLKGGNGKSLEFNWNGTELGIKREGDDSYSYVNLKGKDGREGVDGIDGVTPDIKIGTVTTLEAGENATVTREGTNENPIFNFGIPKGADGTPAGGSSGSVIIADFEVNGMKEIQPTSLDLNTGIFTCDKVVFTGNTQIIPKEKSISKFPKELILHNSALNVVKLSETTFKIQKGSSDINYSSDQSNVDVSAFKFSQGTSISIENINMDDDGVYVIHLHGLRGRVGQTSFCLQDINYKQILYINSLVDGKPILFITTEITVTKNKDMYSYGVLGRYVYNKISGATLDFNAGGFDAQRDFNKTDKKISKLRINGQFVNNTRVWIEKVI